MQQKLRQMMQEKAALHTALAAEDGDVLLGASSTLHVEKEEIIQEIAKGADEAYDALESASAALQADHDVVLAAVAQNGYALCYTSAALKADSDFILQVLDVCFWAPFDDDVEVPDEIKQLPEVQVRYEALRADKPVVLAAVAQNGNALRYASAALKDNRDFILQVLDVCFWAPFADAVKVPDEIKQLPEVQVRYEALRADKAVVLAAVAQFGGALLYASAALQGDHDVVLAAVAQFGGALKYASAALQADHDVVLVAVAQSGEALQCASAALQADHDVVLVAVAQDGRALQFASAALQADRDVVLAAVAQNGNALQYASAALKVDPGVVFIAMQNGYRLVLRNASSALQADRDVVLAAVAQAGSELEYASAALKADRDVVLAAVAQSGGALDCASVALKADRDVVLAAVAQDGWALDYASSALRADPAIRRAAGKESSRLL